MVVKKVSTKPARATAMSPTNAALVMGGGGGAPKFTTQPGSVSGDVDTTVTFQAIATGKPTITYQWQVDTGVGFADIPGATSTSYTTPILVIGDDQNDYRCVATNSQGSTNSDTATLTVPSVYLAYSVGDQFDNDADAILLRAGGGEPESAVFRSGTKPYVFGATGLPTGLSIDTVSGDITGTIDSDASESSPYSVVVTCTDADTASATDSFTWTVANVPPVQLEKIPPQTDQDENVISLDMSVYFASPDGGTLTYTATGLPTGLSIGLNDGVVSGTITSGANTSSPFTSQVTASDGTDSVVGDSFQWTVNAVSGSNRAPTLDLAIADVTWNTDAVISLDVSVNFSDPDGDALTFTATGLPGTLSCSTSGLISGTIDSDANISSPYTVTIRATDPGALFVEDTFQATVIDPPDYNVWVDVSNPGGIGTELDPYGSIQEGIDGASSGDYLFVAGGTYKESVVVNKTNIRIEGERSGSDWLTILEPPAVSISWTLAPEMGPNVWVTTDISGSPEILSYNGKTIAKLGAHMMGAGEWGRDVLASPDPWVITGNPGVHAIHNGPPGGIDFWSMLYSVWGQVGSSTYVRFKDGSNPNSVPIVVGANGEQGMYWPSTGAGSTVADIWIRGSDECIRIHNSSHNNTVEDCKVTNYRRGIRLYTGMDNTRITGCTLDSGIDGGVTGAWGGGDTIETGTKEFIYEFWKYTYHTADSSSSGIYLWNTGDNTIIEDCEFTGGISGIIHYASGGSYGIADGTIVRNNSFSNHSSLGFYMIPGHTNTQFYGNTLTDANSLIRLGSLHVDLETSMFIYNNKIHNPAALGQAIKMHVYTGTPDYTQPREINIYHNSFSGPTTISTYDSSYEAWGGMSDWHYLNNICSPGSYMFSRVADPAYVGTFDYNWFGGPNTSDSGNNTEPWYGANNLLHNGEVFWAQTDTPPDWVVPVDSDAKDASANAMSFDGVDDYVDVFDSEIVSAAYQSLSTLSISGWIKPTGVDTASATWRSGHTVTELREEQGAGAHCPFNLGVSLEGGDIKLSFGTTINYSAGWELLNSTANLVDDTRVHVAVTVNGDVVRLYINGSFDSTLTLTQAAGDRSVGTTLSNMQLGVRARDGGQKDSNFYEGEIEYLRIDSDVWTDNEVAWLYDSGTGDDPTETSMVEEWSFGMPAHWPTNGLSGHTDLGAVV